MDFDHIRSLSDLETYYHTHRLGLPDPVDDLIYAILQDRSVKKVLPQSSNLQVAGTQGLVLALQFLPALQRLELPYGKVGDLGVKLLTRVLPDLKELRYIGLGSNDISPMGVFYLASAIGGLEKLEGLDLSGNMIREEGVGMLAESLSARLITLSLRSCGFDPARSEGLHLLLTKHIRLKVLDIRFNIATITCHFGTLLRNNTAINTLEVTGCRLNTYSLVGLYMALPCLPALEELGVGYCDHSEEAAIILGRVLQPAFRSLLLAQDSEKELYLHSNPLLSAYLR